MGIYVYLYDVGVVENMEMFEFGEDVLELEFFMEEEKFNFWFWMGVLLVVILGVVVELELLVGFLEVVMEFLGLIVLFIGVIVLFIIGNVVEYVIVVIVVMKDKMDFFMFVVMGLSL